jgi:hypothetical protein
VPRAVEHASARRAIPGTLRSASHCEVRAFCQCAHTALVTLCPHIHTYPSTSTYVCHRIARHRASLLYVDPLASRAGTYAPIVPIVSSLRRASVVFLGRSTGDAFSPRASLQARHPLPSTAPAQDLRRRVPTPAGATLSLFPYACWPLDLFLCCAIRSVPITLRSLCAAAPRYLRIRLPRPRPRRD